MQSSVKKTKIRQKHDNTMYISIARLVSKRERKRKTGREGPAG